MFTFDCGSEFIGLLGEGRMISRGVEGGWLDTLVNAFGKAFGKCSPAGKVSLIVVY